MALLIIALIIEPVEMVFQSYRILEPWLYLALQIYKAAVATILLIIGIYVMAVQTDNTHAFSISDAVLVAFTVLIAFMA